MADLSVLKFFARLVTDLNGNGAMRKPTQWFEILEPRRLLSSASPVAAVSAGIPEATPALLLKYTYFGDPNLNGEVDGSDYSNINSGYQSLPQGWTGVDSTPAPQITTSSPNGATPEIASSNLPVTTVAGNSIKSSVQLKLTNANATTDKGLVVSIYGVGSDGKDQLIATERKKNTAIKPRSSVSISVPITSIPANVPEDSYYLMASTKDSQGVVAWYKSMTTFSVQSRQNRLTESATVISSKRSATGTVSSSKVALTILNSGNTTLSGLKQLGITAVDQSERSLLSVARVSKKLNLKPGQSITVMVTVKKQPTSLNDPYFFHTAVSDPVSGESVDASADSAIFLFGVN